MVANTPVRKFLLTLRGASPIKQDGSMLSAKFACPKCNTPAQIQFCQGGALLQSQTQLRELFERVGTQISIANKDVLAGAKIKDIGDLVIDWCREASIGEVRDVPELAVTISRVEDDLADVQRIESKPAPRLVMAGGSC